MNKTFDTETSSATATEAPSTSECWGGISLEICPKNSNSTAFFGSGVLGYRWALAALQEKNII